MASQRTIPVANLLLDAENPRLAEGDRSQAETIQAMLLAEGPKTLALADSIAREGLSPSERLLVMPSSDHDKRYVVLEGNRRTTALKLLAEPNLADGAITPNQLSKLKRSSGTYKTRGEIDKVECTVFDTREEANPWIERRHRGEQQGVGIISWGGMEAARFDARSSGKHPPELQVLDYVAAHGNLAEATLARLHGVSITNLQRIISDKDMRHTLGLSIDEEGRIATQFPEKETLKALTRIVEDLAHERIKVKDIYNRKARQTYLAKFKASELPAGSTRLPAPAPLVGVGTHEAASASKGKPTTKKHSASGQPRPQLIPSTCKFDIDVPKLQNIHRELRRLKLEEYPNATSVLFRVYIELTVDELIERDEVMSSTQAQNSKLRDKLTKAADHLQATGRLTTNQAKAAKKVATDQHFLHTSMTTMHQYVHNKEFSPSATDLRAAWDNIQPFFAAVWSS